MKKLTNFNRNTFNIINLKFNIGCHGLVKFRSLEWPNFFKIQNFSNQKEEKKTYLNVRNETLKEEIKAGFKNPTIFHIRSDSINSKKNMKKS